MTANGGGGDGDTHLFVQAAHEQRLSDLDAVRLDEGGERVEVDRLCEPHREEAVSSVRKQTKGRTSERKRTRTSYRKTRQYKTSSARISSRSFSPAVRVSLMASMSSSSSSPSTTAAFFFFGFLPFFTTSSGAPSSASPPPSTVAATFFFRGAAFFLTGAASAGG